MYVLDPCTRPCFWSLDGYAVSTLILALVFVQVAAVVLLCTEPCSLDADSRPCSRAGGSSGSAVYCALQAIRDYDLTTGQRCVVILPDSVRNYM